MGDLRQLLGNRIRDTRIRLSFTQRQLAEEAGFASGQIISQIEKGERDIKAWELINIAEALQIDTSQLLKDNLEEEVYQVFWRKAPVRDKSYIEAEFTQKCSQYALLERLCEITVKHELPSRDIDLTSMTYNQAEQFGTEIREHMNLGNRPALSLAGVLEDQYLIKVWYSNFGNHGSAASTKGPYGCAILINSTEAPWRRNYSFAHELFHLLTWESIKPSFVTDGELVESVEKLAEAFASSLLLPKEELNQIISSRIKDDELSYIDIIDTAREFDVSTIALLWRLCHLGVIEADDVYEFNDNSELRGLDRDARIGSWLQPPEIPERFVRLAFTAYQKGKLSRARLSEFLNTSLIDLTDRLLEYGLDDQEDYQTSIRAIRR